jgi:hypothetical protein
MTYPITTQKEVRRLFWERFAGYRDISKRRLFSTGDYNTDTRCAFVDYVDNLCRNGDISETLASRVTL